MATLHKSCWRSKVSELAASNSVFFYFFFLSDVISLSLFTPPPCLSLSLPHMISFLLLLLFLFYFSSFSLYGLFHVLTPPLLLWSSLVFFFFITLTWNFFHYIFNITIFFCLFTISWRQNSDILWSLCCCAELQTIERPVQARPTCLFRRWLAVINWLTLIGFF